ncbi:hypothetical protein [Streptomyces sp. ADI96-02]|uniref:hypothetical protein n=1 Tax=Streptomyces sp. ADI96-02 TaxID=1522760 RepID=UPI000F559A38|nr:hypothetical protein [Streptomyces sp. ADI96-02]
MDTQHDTSLGHALTGIPGPLPPSGVIHLAVPHTGRFTVVGNHLAQHAELSLTAIGLAVHIQSLPTGAPVGVKRLAGRFPEGEIRIAAALRELEAHGYLHRVRLRLPNGRVVTRTVSCNRPDAIRAATPGRPAAVRAAACPAAVRRPAPDAIRAAACPVPVRQPAPVAPKPPLGAEATETREEPAMTAPAPAPPPASAPSAPEPARVPEHPPAPVLLPAPTAPRPPLAPLPQPHELTPDLHRTATALLADLRRRAPQLVLSEADVDRLAPGVAAWIERDAHPDTIRHALTTDLPQPLNHPARLLRHRLTALLPPPLPSTQDLTPPRRAPAASPFQTCDGCERAFRSHRPGHCRDCRDRNGEAA